MKKDIDELDKIEIVCHCGGKTKRIETSWEGFPVRAWKCGRCGEEIFHPLDAQRALTIAKAIKNKEFEVKIRKVGKSLTMTIPRRLAEMFGLKEGKIAQWGVQSDRFVIKIKPTS